MEVGDINKREFMTYLVSENPYDLHEPPLDMFGADAVERWFTEKEVKEVVEFANRMAV